jgi:hypothetical protein
MVTGYFAAWATQPCGVVKRLEVEACTQHQAIAAAFAAYPRSVAVSARPIERGAPMNDALGMLDRRAKGQS